MIINNYNIILGNTKDNINKMINYFNVFMKIKDEKHIGIDFEFNRVNNERQIALFQINLESKNTKTIFMFYPRDLNKDQLNILKNLLYSKNIIIHGGESLDIPYLFSEIFSNNKEIIKFLKNVKDTKFQCESYNYENNLNEYKCKIYYLLKQMNVIDNIQFNYLIKNEENMGPIYDIFIDVKNMKKELILYSAYDVLYLPRLIKSFPNNNFYRKLLPDITNIIIYSKYINFIDDNSFILNKLNNFFIIVDNNKKLFNDVYKKNVDKIESKYYDILLNINYFKKFFLMIIKLSVYIYLTNNYKYFINKEEISNKKLRDFNYYIKIFNKFKHGSKFIKKINLKIVKDIIL